MEDYNNFETDCSICVCETDCQMQCQSGCEVNWKKADLEEDNDFEEEADYEEDNGDE